MRTLFLSLLVATAPAALAYGQPAAAPVADNAQAQADGRALVQDILAQRPERNTTITGTLNIQTNRASRIQVPVKFEIAVDGPTWRSSYLTAGSNQNYSASLEIVHAIGQPSVYKLSQTNVSGDKAMVPFAGSDFWLADLGLEFFHWPEQRLLKKEIRRGRSCRVLESVNPQPASGYSRVVSWVDRETSGIVFAEAYDAGGKLLKEFSPKEFKKVNGQWQLQEMEMRNVQTGSRSQIEFDLATGQ